MDDMSKPIFQKKINKNILKCHLLNFIHSKQSIKILSATIKSNIVG